MATSIMDWGLRLHSGRTCRRILPSWSGNRAPKIGFSWPLTRFLERGAGSTKALQDPAFRDAIGYAIDQKAIVERAMRGHADPGLGLVIPAAADYYSDLSDIKRHFDLAEAGRRLDAAGYRDKDGDGVREDKEGKSFQLELITSSEGGNGVQTITTVQLIAAWLGQVGIPVSVTQLDGSAFGARWKTPENGGGAWDLLVDSNWLSPRTVRSAHLG
ncbi:ABC transporter substrate-binding protein (plasmid) [Sinorhizobium meliloti]|nr:ABC transporter substrate-binding protein [Sinorhizobium meliloti]